MPFYIGLSLGEKFITGGVVHYKDKKTGTTNISAAKRREIGTNGIVDVLASLVKSLHKTAVPPEGISISITDSFLSQQRLLKKDEPGKQEGSFGLDLVNSLANRLHPLGIKPDNICLVSESRAFLLGMIDEHGLQNQDLMAITIGKGVANVSFRGDCFCEEFWEKERFTQLFFASKKVDDEVEFEESTEELNDRVKEAKNPVVKEKFEIFGKDLAQFLQDIITGYNPDLICLGGRIFNYLDLFEESFQRNLENVIPYLIVSQTTQIAARGAVIHHKNLSNSEEEKYYSKRLSVSRELPLRKNEKSDSGYDIYPTFSLKNNVVKTGYASLAEFISQQNSQKIIIDGYAGVLWDEVVSSLNAEFNKLGLKVNWYNINAALKPEHKIEKQFKDFLGRDPVFGKLYSGTLSDVFQQEDLEKVKPTNGLNIIYGTGAALAGWEGTLIYIDVPKNEIQYRSRAKSISNIGFLDSKLAKEAYKQFYFVDWPICNQHKKELLPNITALVDGQRIDSISWIRGDEFRKALTDLSHHPFRVRPWFEPGVWGGNWIQKHIKGTSQKARNLAWSFECIVPENGIILESDDILLEFSFDFLMYHDNKAILGVDSSKYGYELPIRFDFLDTMEGQNLSLQCHPTTSYIQKHFGETITQDETYYILDAKPDAEVYLGFKEEIDPYDFRQELEHSQGKGRKVDVKKYVQTFSSSKHDLFLIPAGTVHCSGKDNMVLEISNTPYIYTFKMYDWQRLDLDGKPRPINIERAFENLNFDRKGKKVEQKLISNQQVLEQGDGWKISNLPTHSEHLYGIHRLEFDQSIDVTMQGKFHILNLVEGDSIEIVAGDRLMKIHFAETFIIPASTQKYRLINKTSEPVKVIKAFVKKDDSK